MAYVSASASAALPSLGGEPLARVAETLRTSSEPEALTASFDVVDGRAAFDALEAEWNDLFQRAGRSTQLFQSFNWNWHWANHYLPAMHAKRGGTSLAIVTVRRHGRLVMLWPLVVQRIGGLEVLRWMGEPASQYGDVLAEELPDALQLMRRAWRFITTRLGADAVFLRKVRADATVAPLLRELGLRQTAEAEALYLDLASAPDFALYEQRYTAKARKNRRRLSRRLAEQGPLVVERHAAGVAARAAALQAIELKRTWIEKTGRMSAAFADERFAAFFADAAEGRDGRSVGCGVTVLRSNGAPAGIAIDITCDKHRAAHVIVHDPRLDGCSAGTLLFEMWIKGASADGMATFDLLAPAYAYKMDWADGTIAVGDFAQGLTLAGRAYVDVYLGRVRRKLKAAVEAWPDVVARLRGLRELAWPARRAPVGPEAPATP